MTQTTKFPLIPAQTALANTKGLAANQWYFFWKYNTDQLQKLIQGGPYATTDGSATSIKEGLYANLGSGTAGEIYFTTDTNQIFINVAGTWQEQIPAFSGDASSPAGSPVLTLASVNPITYGTFKNVNTITVNEKGLVTFVQSGPDAAQ